MTVLASRRRFVDHAVYAHARPRRSLCVTCTAASFPPGDGTRDCRFDAADVLLATAYLNALTGQSSLVLLAGAC